MVSLLKRGVVAGMGALGLLIALAAPVNAAPEGKASAAAVKSAKPSSKVVAASTASASKTKAKPRSVKAKKSSQRATRLSRKALRQQARELDDRVGDTLTLRSSSALVMDQRSGEILFEKNADQPAAIASITKVMTAMVVIDAAQDLTETISISRDDIDRFKGSHSRLQVGLEMSREQALLLALMASENRAANALGRHFPGGMPAFVEAMNHKAAALGMENTRFVDPTGLSSKNVSTAQDLGKMVAAAHEYPLIRELSTTPLAQLEIGKRHRLMGFTNTNALVKSPAWDIGLSKTGYISEAGKCLVMQAWVAGRPTVVVLLDSWGRLTRIGDANRVKRWLEKNDALAARIEPRA